MIKQRTIKKEVKFFGTGIHTGAKTSFVIKPAAENTGILFSRTDLPGTPPIPALLENVGSNVRSTNLMVHGVEIKTVEHILSCLHGLNIDNAFIEVHGPEIPVMDGSSSDFVSEIYSAGFSEQNCERYFVVPKEVIHMSYGDSYLIFLPANEFRITYLINYNHPVLQTQVEDIIIEPRNYIEKISRARTYGFMEEVQYLKDNNLAIGGSLDNALLIMKDGYSSPLRYENEPVRHKILDLIGDLYLLGSFIKGHIIAVKSSHKLNVEFAGIIKNKIK